MFRPRGDLCWLQRPLFPLAVGVRPQRQPRACSQPCRLTYDLTDGRGRTYIAGKHLLSVRDLNLSAHIGELLDAGVTSFKIEGRLKDVGYIKNIVAYYRREVDAALAVRPHLRRASAGRASRISRPIRPRASRAGSRNISSRASGRAWRRSIRRRRWASMWAVWCGSKRTGSVSIGAVCSPRATASVSSPTGVRRHQCQRRRRRMCDAQPHGRYCARDGGLPQLRPPFQPAPRPQPYAPRDPRLGAGRSDGRGC